MNKFLLLPPNSCQSCWIEGKRGCVPILYVFKRWDKGNNDNKTMGRTGIGDANFLYKGKKVLYTPQEWGLAILFHGSYSDAERKDCFSRPTQTGSVILKITVTQRQMVFYRAAKLLFLF
jgi:hypothetical protein